MQEHTAEEYKLKNIDITNRLIEGLETYCALYKYKITPYQMSIYDLKYIDVKAFSKIPGVGEATVVEFIQLLAKYNIIPQK